MMMMMMMMSRWPQSTNLTYSFWRCTCIAEMNFLGQDFQQLQHYRQTEAQTDKQKTGRPMRLTTLPRRIHLILGTALMVLSAWQRMLQNGVHYICSLLKIYTVFQKTWCWTFCHNFVNCWPILRILSLLETTMNYLQDKCNIFRSFWKPRCTTVWNIEV